MDLIPQEMKEINQWTYSYSEEELKRPWHFHYRHNGALPHSEAKKIAGENKYIGFYTTLDDPYVLMDIDKVQEPQNPFSELPVPLANLIMSRNTYSEVSPSGHGLRVIFKLPSAKEKQKVDGMIFYISKDMGKKQCQINFGQPWQTITGNATPFAIDQVGEISLQELAEVFTLRWKDVKGDEHPAPLAIDIKKLPPINELSTALLSIPLDQNPRVQRAYEKTFNVVYSHYEFWIKMLMGIHHYGEVAGKEIQCLELVLNWSAMDPTAFEGEENVHKHWRSFGAEQQEIVSYKSVFGVANHYKLRWTVPKKRSKEEIKINAPYKPLNSEYVNFKDLLNYYCIELHRDEGNLDVIYMTGDEDIIEEYFMMHRVKPFYDIYYGPFTRDTLIPSFHMFSQIKGFVGLTHPQTTAFIKNLLAETTNIVNLIKMFFDTPYDRLPKKYKVPEHIHENTTFETLFKCLHIDTMTDNSEKEEELYRSYYKKWLMGMIRNIYFKDMKQTNNCVLLLTGKEQIRKTSHFRYLFPSFMRELVAFTTHGFASETSMRDVVKLSATNLVIVWDELEQFLITGAESNFKKIIDGLPTKIIDKYETVEKTVYPIAVYGATSNMREFRLGSEGSRRLFHIPVSWVDTDEMQNICWHKLINELKREATWQIKTGNIPWLLTSEQLSYQMQLHSGIRAKTSIDHMLEEVFNFDSKLDLRNGGRISGIKSIQTDKTGRLMTIRQISDTLARAGFNAAILKRPALVKSLERMCGDYTGTRTTRIALNEPRCQIFKGLATQHHYKKYVMPSIRPEIIGSIFSQFESVAGDG